MKFSVRQAIFKSFFYNSPALLAAFLLTGTAAPLPGQTVSFTGIQTTVGNWSNPPSGVAVDGAGNVFVADNSSSIAKVAPDGIQTTISSGFNGASGVAVDGVGDVFVADTYNGRLVKVFPDGTQTTAGSGFNEPRGVAVDGAGNVFVADGGYGRVVKIAPNGTQTTVATGFNTPTGVAVDGVGDVFVAGTYGVVKVTPDGTQTAVGSGFNVPFGVAVDSTGNVFVGDSDNKRVVKVTPDGTQTTVGSGFSAPFGVAVDSTGNVFVADYNNKRVVKVQFNPNFGNVNLGANTTLSLNYQVNTDTTLGPPVVLTEGAPNQDFTLASGSTCSSSLAAGSSCAVKITFTPRFAGLRRGAVQVVNSGGTVLTTTYVQGLGVGPQIAFGSSVQTPIGSGFSDPSGVAVDGAGNVFVADANSGSVTKVAPDGTQISVGSGFSSPEGVAVDGAGNVFVADYENNSVTKVTPTGAQTPVGSGFVHVQGVAVDGAGNVFVAGTSAFDRGEVIKVAPDGTQTPILLSQFNDPWGVAVDGVGNVFVTYPHSGSVTKVALGGTQTSVGSGFNSPHGVAVDGAGNVFVADSGNNRVVKVAPDGTQTTVGSGLNSPAGVAVDGAGNVWVADAQNSRVVELPRSQSPSLTFAVTPVGSTSTDSPQSFTVENIGNAPLNGSGLAVTGNFAQVPGSGTPADCTANFSLAPGATCNVSLSFTPTASGPLSGTVTLTDNALNGNPAIQTVKLSGTGQLVAQTITFNPVASPQTAGTTLTLSATASSGLAVSFTSQTPAVCTISGTTAMLLTSGNCSIQASQGGNTKYAVATPVTQSFTVNQKAQTISFGAITSHAAGTTLTLSATASSGLPVSFTSSTTGVCAVSGTTATLLSAGTCTIQATQYGNAQYAAAPPVTQSFTVIPAANFTIAVIPPTETALFDSVAGFILKLQSVNGFQGSVKLSCSGGPASSYCVDLPKTVPVNGTAYAVSGILFPRKTTKPGTYTITFTGVSGTLTNTASATFTVK